MKYSYIGFIAYILFLFPNTAFAYIDPGVGSLLLQGLAAAGFTLILIWRSFRNKLSKFFNKKKDTTQFSKDCVSESDQNSSQYNSSVNREKDI